MLIRLNKKIAYLCPYCSEICGSNLSLFSVSRGHGIDLFCTADDCGEKCVTISKKSGKYVFTVECPVCADTHTFTLNAASVLNKPQLSLKCPVSDIEILMIGNDGNLPEIFENTINSYSDLIEPFMPDAIFMQMIAIIEKLSRQGDISCICGNEHIQVSAGDDSIRFMCPKCGRKKEITVNEENLAALLAASSIILQ